MTTSKEIAWPVDSITSVVANDNTSTGMGTEGSTNLSDLVHANNRLSRDAPIPKRRFQQVLKSAVLCALVTPSPQLAHANPTIIDGPVTVTQTIYGNESLIITPTGSITATINAIRANNSLNTIINSGAITTTGNYGHAIDAPDGSNTFINSGSISTTGDYAHGIIADSGANLINNSGSISTTGTGSHGINAFNVGNTIINSGAISLTGASYANGISASNSYNIITNLGSIDLTASNGYGISAGSFSTMTNSGLINSSGDYAEGIDAINSNTITNSGSINMSGASAIGIKVYNSNTIINSGSISVSGAGGYGVYLQGNANSITNSGSINVSGGAGYGIRADGNNNTVSNSGDIISKDGYAVYFNGSGNTLNSVNNFISGGIYLGSNAIVSLATGANYSKLYTFGGSLSAINGSGPLPLFKNVSTQQAGTHDPTLFASSADSLADMTNTIASMAPNRFNGSDNQHPFWAKGFGMTASYAGTEATLTHRNNVYGAAIGYDVKRSMDLTLGLMGGYGQSHQWADGITMPSFNTSSDDGFLGMYGQKRWQRVALDFALYGGLQNIQQQRDVNDNLAYAGQSSAKASYQGWWISPDIGVTLNAGDINGWSVLPTARLRYAQQWLGGYTETGAGAANANVNGRTVAIGQGFIGIGTRKTIKTQMGKDTRMVFDGQIGYIYRGVVGDTTVGVTMIGQSLVLPTEARSRSGVAVSAGVTLDLSSAVALKLRGDFEGGEGINHVSGGWAGLSIKF